VAPTSAPPQAEAETSEEEAVVEAISVGAVEIPEEAVEVGEISKKSHSSICLAWSL
jgi:hypothetical protein